MYPPGGRHFVLNWRRLTMILLGIVTVFRMWCSVSADAEDFDAAKSAPQLFASNCSSCHRSPYGLAKRMNSWSLDSFLREHYTASHASADTLSAYLIGIGANARDGQHKQSTSIAPTTNQRNGSTSRPAPDSRASVDPLSAYLFGIGGTARDGRHKRSELVASTASHRNQSALRPPADIPNR
jgi:mono/diheme cytochrome c family protein